MRRNLNEKKVQDVICMRQDVCMIHVGLVWDKTCMISDM